ncbi:MAG: hypothetical protein JOZ10_07335 [Acidobacteria bacterium]|nr:hypothetical protein [Acidobacteriota bacterium]MBV9147598.1 hypothetical protein [Acidobacteriota bacterium]
MSSYAASLRQELAARAVEFARTERLSFRRSHAEFGSLVFLPDWERMRHGNFHPASFRAILKRAIWRKRLGKALTVPERLQSCDDQHRLCELDSCCSSDALLMNIFCHPQARKSSTVLGMLGLCETAVPIFGWRARVPLRDGGSDRTEVDMKFGTLLVESKLTESSFESCAIERMKGYREFEKVFRLSELPRSRGQYHCYQLLRNVLAAHAHNASFCLITDCRRQDFIEAWFTTLSAIRNADLRVRCKLLTWQELSEALSPSLQKFLARKYGIGRDVAALAAPVGY